MNDAGAIDVGAAIETQSGTSFSRLVLILCCAAMVIEGYDVQVLAYAAPAIIRDWKVEQALFGPVFGAALFGYLLGATLGARHRKTNSCQREDWDLVTAEVGKSGNVRLFFSPFWPPAGRSGVQFLGVLPD